MVNNSTNIDKTNNIGQIVDHHCLEVIVRLVDIGQIVDHHCLEVIVRLVDIGQIVDHHCLEVIVHLVDIWHSAPRSMLRIRIIGIQHHVQCLGLR
jgi:hypothetical protein